MSCMWITDGFYFKFNSGQFNLLPAEMPTISILESSVLPTELLTFFIFESSGLPTELPTVFIFGSSWQPYLHGKIPLGSPLRCRLSCPLFSYLEAVGCLLSYPLSCPLFSYTIVVSSPICMENPHWQPTPLHTCIPLAVNWAAPLFFRMGKQK